jgi:HEAT repeat protein
MWRLFPKSWFRSQGRDGPQMAVAAESFENQWRDLLTHTLAQVMGRETLSVEEAVTLLPTLDTAILLSFDGTMRRGWHSYYSEYASRGRAPTLTLVSDPTEGAAFLFTAACQSNGFIRERAIIAFEHYPGRLALVAALIRCDDWVPPVQRAAVTLLVRLAETHIGELLYEQLPLLLRLQRRQRVAEELWARHIEPVLRSPRFRNSRWHSTKSPDAAARTFAYRLILQADPDRSGEVFSNACADLHPQVALWSIGSVGQVLDPGRAEELIRRAIRHRNSAVRAAALRHYASLGTENLREELEESIFDSSRGPRDAAAYLLQSLFHLSARDRWRQVIDAGPGERLRVAVTAVSYVAESGDVERLEPFLDDPTARIRAAALRGLIRAKAGRSDEYFMRALRDQSGLVVRHAMSLVSKEGQLLGRAELEHAYASAQSEAVRRQLVRGARLLEKWDTLRFLLPLLSTSEALVAREEVTRWIQSANRRFAGPDPEDRRVISQYLAELGQSTDARQRLQILEIMRHS